MRSPLLQNSHCGVVEEEDSTFCDVSLMVGSEEKEDIGLAVDSNSVSTDAQLDPRCS